MLENTNTIPFDDNILTMEKRGFLNQKQMKGKESTLYMGLHYVEAFLVKDRILQCQEHTV